MRQGKTQHKLNLDCIFNPRSIAVIGASKHPDKIGYIILKNFIDNDFRGGIYPINPDTDEILGLRCYPSVLAVKEKIDCAVIAVPAAVVPKVLEECGKKGVKGAVVISGGFKEVGNIELEKKIVAIADKYHITMIGPNVMGILDTTSRADSIFLPHYKVERPKAGQISVITQSGAVGGCILDMAAQEKMGMAKFVSYGNAAMVDEADLLDYLADDKKTGTIVMYMEGVKNGKRFKESLRNATRKKPVIVLKAGVSENGRAAAKSHTGAMAGSDTAYRAVFKQMRAVSAETFEDLFHFTKIFTLPRVKGKRIAVITNGGGNGVLAADAVDRHGLELAQFTEKNRKQLRSLLPSYTNVSNPLDLVGDADAERYEKTLGLLTGDPNIDMFIVIVLFQTASMNADIIFTLINAFNSTKKPMVVVATGGAYTEQQSRILNNYGIPTYQSPSEAVRALRALYDYWETRG